MRQVPKQAVDPRGYLRSPLVLPDARSGIRHFLTVLSDRIGRAPKVILPAYFGYSTREGSGVMDPIREVGAEPVFCRVSRTLQMDVDHLKELLKLASPDALMMIHYFGWPDVRAGEIAQLARAAGLWILEDEAHGLLTDLVGGASGRFGDAATVSLHKSLPVPSGGLLYWNSDELSGPRTATQPTSSEAWAYDLWSISRRRATNAGKWIELIRAHRLPGQLLHDSVPPGVVPLNLPYLVDPDKRQYVYEEMNAKGFGVVCLYHRLGEGIDPEEHPDSFWLSARTVNLPVHQDLHPDDIPAMLNQLRTVLTS